jgi:hypothetical protein
MPEGCGPGPFALLKRDKPEAEFFNHNSEVSTEGTVIFKVHGTLGMPPPFDDTFVITEDDYYEVAGAEHKGRLLPFFVKAGVARSHLVFLGYALRDVHIRVALLRRFRTGGRHFAFTKHLTRMDHLRWHSQKVDAYALDVDSFARIVCRYAASAAAQS